MERLKALKCELIEIIEEQMENPKCVNAEELGEVFDMLKDVSETMYYLGIVKAMEEEGGERNVVMAHHTDPHHYHSSIGNSSDANAGMELHNPAAMPV